MDIPLIDKKNKQIALSQPKSAPFYKMFMFATSYDYTLIFVGTVGAILGGSAMPIYTIVFGNLANTMVTSTLTMSIAREYSLYYIIIGVASFITNYVSFSCWIIVGERQNLNIRKAYFKALLR